MLDTSLRFADDHRMDRRLFWQWIGMWCRLEPLAPAWRLPVFVALGVLAGLGVMVIQSSRAISYLSDEPEACINCHVMNQAYAAWQHGSHHLAAQCVDCHLPHQNPVAKLAFKARDGLRHSYVFTFRLEPQVMQLSEGAVPVVQENCLRCHASQFFMVRLAAAAERRCWDCHDGAHGRVTSLSAAPFARRPPIPSAGLDLFK